MAEVRNEQKIICVNMICDKCGKGKMKTPNGDGFIDACYSTRYLHECTECGHREFYDRRYPYLEYVDVD